MSKLKGTTLCNVNTISKEGSLSCFWFHIYCSQSTIRTFPIHQTPSMHMLTWCKVKTKWLHNTWLGPKYFWNAFITFKEVAMTIYTLFEDCIHHIFSDRLHLSRTLGCQRKMSCRQLIMSPHPKNRTGHFSNLISNQHSQFYNWMRWTLVRPPGITTHLISQPHQAWFSNNFWTPADNQGVHSRKAKDNSTTSIVLGNLPVTSVRESARSRTASSLERKSPGTNKRTQTWPSITRTKSEMLCKEVTLPSMRHCSPQCQRWPTL